MAELGVVVVQEDSDRLPVSSPGDVVRFVFGMMSGIFALVAVWGLAEWVSITAANSLPGVVAFKPEEAGLGLYLGVVMTAFALVFSAAAVVPRWSVWGLVELLRAPGLVVVRAWVVLVALLRKLGLVAPWRRILAGVGVGLAAGVLSYVVKLGIANFVDLPGAHSVDERVVATAGASRLVSGLWAGTMAGLPEEILFRGPLLLWVVAVDRFASRAWVRHTLVVVGVVVSSVVFGLVHLAWSPLNAVTATVSGLIFGVVVVWRRSLWAGVAAHWTSNFLGSALVGLW